MSPSNRKFVKLMLEVLTETETLWNGILFRHLTLIFRKKQSIFFLRLAIKRIYQNILWKHQGCIFLVWSIYTFDVKYSLKHVMGLVSTFKSNLFMKRQGCSWASTRSFKLWIWLLETFKILAKGTSINDVPFLVRWVRQFRTK